MAAIDDGLGVVHRASEATSACWSVSEGIDTNTKRDSNAWELAKVFGDEVVTGLADHCVSAAAHATILIVVAASRQVVLSSDWLVIQVVGTPRGCGVRAANDQDMLVWAAGDVIARPHQPAIGIASRPRGFVSPASATARSHSVSDAHQIRPR
eukprot:COSAG03_NODE_2173_length_3048_cov_3.062733_3_plen_153_part_00